MTVGHKISKYMRIFQIIPVLVYITVRYFNYIHIDSCPMSSP